MVDLDGTFRSRCDTPIAAFYTKKEAVQYIEDNMNDIGLLKFGGYDYEIKVCPFFKTSNVEDKLK